MTYDLTFVQKPAYLHATVAGLNSQENVMHRERKFLGKFGLEAKLKDGSG